MTEDFNPAQFFILGFDGTIPEKNFLRLIEQSPPAGFLLLENNYRSPEQLRSLVSDLKRTAGDRTLIAVDQEPGRIQRFKNGFPVSKTPAVYIDGNLTEEFKTWCSETASMLRETGVNLNLAPVLDIAPDSNTNPVLTDRIFGDDPAVSAAFADILIREHEAQRVLTCGKHFPGLGSARFDPHIKLSISDEPLNQYVDYYWQPFAKAAESGVDFMMTTHLEAALIDPGNAATFSANTIGFLRNMVKFQGPVISDDLIMGGAGDPDSIGSSAIRAIESGHNLLIVSGDAERQKKILDSIKNRYARDEMFAKIAVENEEIIRRIRSKILL